MSRHSAGTIESQTGWKRRPMSVSLCQDSDMLAKVREFSFDLNDLDFVLYYTSRTGDDIIHADCGWDKMRAFIMLPQDDRYMQIRKGKLQDCWELWLQHGPEFKAGQ